MKSLLKRISIFRRLSILPGHFYSPVLLPEELEGRTDELFLPLDQKLHGIDLNEASQVDLLNKLLVFYKDVPFTHNRQNGMRYYYNNNFFSYNSAIELFCLIRYLNPKKIIEVGSGFSSAAILDTNELFFNRSIQLEFIEPFPENRLNKLMRNEDRSIAKVYPCKLQDVNIEMFYSLEANDILFVDSSHVSKPGSDVNMLFFQILPLLKPGVIIHFHDIFYPFEYPKEWVLNKGGFGWNELYLLRSFIMYNLHFEIFFFSSFMEEKHQKWFKEHMPLCLKKQGGSIYLRKK